MAKKPEKNTSDQPQPPSFEKAMEELEKIVEELEGGDLTLDESLTRYERGVKAVKACREILETAEKKLNILLSDEDGKLSEVPFEEDDGE